MISALTIVCSRTHLGNYRPGGDRMATWLWIVLIVLLVLLLFGGFGYRRRGL